MPWIRPIGVAAGLHVVLPLPSTGPTEDEVIAAAAARSIGLFGLGRFWHGPGEHQAGLVVGYAAPPQHLFPAAVRALVETLAGLER
jgi:GntR family transcriptional regulator/MocR family aminotransferase